MITAPAYYIHNMKIGGMEENLPRPVSILLINQKRHPDLADRIQMCFEHPFKLYMMENCLKDPLNTLLD